LQGALLQDNDDKTFDLIDNFKTKYLNTDFLDPLTCVQFLVANMAFEVFGLGIEKLFLKIKNKQTEHIHFSLFV
jgi:hypothetical protein